jgi:hypothetical protein
MGKCSKCGKVKYDLEYGVCGKCRGDPGFDFSALLKERRRKMNIAPNFCNDTEKAWKKWKKGEHTFNKCEEALIKLKSGQKLGNILENCTICPVGNASCEHFMEFSIYGFNPFAKGKLVKLIICSIGIEGNGEKCPLNK